MIHTLGSHHYSFHPLNKEWNDSPPPDHRASLVNKSVVYVKFDKTLRGGQRAVEQALASAGENPRIAGLMLDLRGTDGAPLNELVRFIDMFVDQGTIVEYRSRSSGEMIRESATSHPAAHAGAVVGLVDETTAAGSEAFAAAIRARGRVLLIGHRTRGDAPLRTTFDLPSGAQLTLSIGDLFEPGGGIINGRGVTPDIVVGPIIPNQKQEADPTIRLGVEVLAKTRSPSRADLLEAAGRLEGPPH